MTAPVNTPTPTSTATPPADGHINRLTYGHAIEHPDRYTNPDGDGYANRHTCTTEYGNTDVNTDVDTNRLRRCRLEHFPAFDHTLALFVVSSPSKPGHPAGLAPLLPCARFAGAREEYQ